MPAPIVAIYRLTCAADEVETLGREIALEQTVEVPESLVTDPRIRDTIVGRVTRIEPTLDQPGRFDVRIEYNADLSAYQIGQTLNLIYGNISLKRNTRLIDLQLPEAFLRRFRGPNFGTEGLRQLVGIAGRPLLATALKPKGSSAEELAAIAGAFAAGGGDIVKDDHNLVEPTFDAFRQRIELCQRAVEEGSRESGRTTLYFPHILGSVGEMERQIEFALRLGIRGILISPLIVGMDVVRHLAEKYPLAIMAHPTFTGAFFHDERHGIEPGLLLGTLFRLIGCDSSIFPNAGGRFTFTPQECRDIAARLRAPLGPLRTAMPAPAGGMRFETIPTMVEQYGADSIFLIGGALLSHSHSLRDSTARFMDRIREYFPEERIAPATPMASACEISSANVVGGILEHLPFQPDFRWGGREPVAYKAEGALPFREVSRIELIGKTGEQTAFDVRYFEIGPGGHSSLEKHVHTHVIIAARGEGVLLSGEQHLPLKMFDIAYVPPLRVHQLRNETNQPFGFFCIVDHDRDRPMAP